MSGSILQLMEIQGQMLLFLFLGAICRKTGIINDYSEKSLSSAITNIVFPCLIFSAMINSLSQVSWKQTGILVLICVGIFLGSFYLGKLCFRKFSPERRCVLVFGLMISNSAFIGLPLVVGIWGSVGVFYATVYMTVSRVFLWTIGVAQFPNYSSGKDNPVLVVLKNPNSIAMFAALIYYYLIPVSLPDFVLSAVSEVGSMSTVLCMVMVGALVRGLSWKKVTDSGVLYFSALRLVVVPLLIFFILKAFRAAPVITGVMTLLVSTPAPTLGSVLASRYDADKEFASILVLVSTLLSLVTIPIIAMLYC